MQLYSTVMNKETKSCIVPAFSIQLAQNVMSLVSGFRTIEQDPKYNIRSCIVIINNHYISQKKTETFKDTEMLISPPRMQ